MESSAVSPLSSRRTGAVAWRVASVGGSAAISLLILFGISRAQQTSVAAPEPLQEELRALVTARPPPAAPLPSVVPEPPPPQELDLAAEPTVGGIVLPPAEKTFAAPAPEVPEIKFALDWEALRPSLTPAAADDQHVYQPTDVDRRPVPVYREPPAFLQSSVERLENPTVELLFIVKTNGRADNVQVLYAPTEELARAAVAALHEWKFRPAVRAGKKVRCLVQQTIILRSAPRSPFGR